jgi:phage head maturation protease
MGGTVALFNHSDNFPLAKVTAGNLRLSTDRIGLRFEADLDPKVSYHNDLIRLIQAGTVDQCSFGFIVAQGGDRWFPSKGYTGPGMDDLEEYEDTDIRVLMSIALLTDCSLVTNPAYTSTFAQVDG